VWRWGDILDSLRVWVITNHVALRFLSHKPFFSLFSHFLLNPRQPHSRARMARRAVAQLRGVTHGTDGPSVVYPIPQEQVAAVLFF